jgi:hypothetical protein
MVSRVRVPQIKNPNIVVRLAETEEEVEAANRLVCANYLDVGLWEDEGEFRRSKYHHSAARMVFVMLDGDRIIGTVSIIKDSHNGLPADAFQPHLMSRLRASGERLAEVTALAVDKSEEQQRSLVLFLYKFLYQYSFYYAGIDRFVATVTPKHAFFYESICCFEKLSNSTNYYYVKLDVQLLTLPLVKAHQAFSERYEAGEDRENFYRFMLVTEHPALKFPDRTLLQRSRDYDWLGHARQLDMPIAA